jgi:hypothetical protein
MPRERAKLSVQELSAIENRHRVYRAFLAEEYDGIGQYVHITLSRNAVTVGVRARVGSGDFGTGQKIPEGTLVTVASYRGHLEILSLGAK